MSGSRHMVVPSRLCCCHGTGIAQEYGAIHRGWKKMTARKHPSRSPGICVHCTTSAVNKSSIWALTAGPLMFYHGTQGEPSIYPLA